MHEFAVQKVKLVIQKKSMISTMDIQSKNLRRNNKTFPLLKYYLSGN